MKTGITGATGKLGRTVVNFLKESALEKSIVALVRSPEKASDMGIEVRKFDYDKPDMLPGALNGIKTLLLISANEFGQRARQHINVIKSAREAGVEWILYTSILHADSSSISLAREHLQTENEIKASGIPFTILRHGWYTENYTGSIGNVLESGVLVGSAGEGKISSAARSDFAEAAATVLRDNDYKGKTLELAGDDAYTLGGLAAEISCQTGRSIQYINLSEAEYADILKSSGLPEEMAHEIAGWDVSASRGDLFDDSHQLSKLIGHPTTSLKESVELALR